MIIYVYNEKKCMLSIIIIKSKSICILEAFNGQEAYEIMRNPNNNVKIVIMDLNMPVMGGK